MKRISAENSNLFIRLMRHCSFWYMRGERVYQALDFTHRSDAYAFKEQMNEQLLNNIEKEKITMKKEYFKMILFGVSLVMVVALISYLILNA